MISIIACISKTSRAIGYQNRLLYHIKSDMARFRELTTSHTIIMGRKTYESLPNGALPNRRNIVVSRTLRKLNGCEVYPTLGDALAAAHHDAFVIGGESIYRQALPLATRLYLTVVDDEPQQADTFFPEFDASEWELTEKEMRNADGQPLTFLEYEKINV